MPALPLASPILGLTALSLAALACGAVTLRIYQRLELQNRTDGRDFAIAAGIGVFGLSLLGTVGNMLFGVAALLVVSGVSTPLLRTIATIRVNSATTRESRATIHSFLSQSEYAGEVLCGLLLAALAEYAGRPAALLGCAILFAGATLAALIDRQRRSET
jgi:hypothetical protein